MIYTVYNHSYGWVKEFNNWWELIAFLSDKESDIAHNDNDVYAFYNCNFFKPKVNNLEYDEHIAKKALNFLIYGSTYFNPIKRYIEKRDLFVYDEYGLINLSEIRDSISIYKPKNKKYTYCNKSFVYRYDPVSGTGVHIYKHYRKIKRNKSYAAKLCEYKNLFPSDSSIAERVKIVRLHSVPKHIEKCWKKQAKKNKQWM